MMTKGWTIVFEGQGYPRSTLKPTASAVGKTGNPDYLRYNNLIPLENDPAVRRQK